VAEQNSRSASKPVPPPALMVWMDLEMTGLDPERDTIIEMATLVTDGELNVIAEGPEIVVRQDAALFAGMDDWNKEHHTKSGLWAKVVASKIALAEAESLTLEFLRRHVGPRESPLCGNSVWQDRRFLLRYMPALEAHLHYRLVDVSSIKEIATRWYPAVKFAKKKGAHRALDDVRESVDELRFYRETLFKDAKDVQGRSS
jgi:oligoribonuclease